MLDQSPFARIADAMAADWRARARPEQLPPEGEWYGWLILAGRGFGKTRTGAEWIREQAESSGRHRLALVGATASDVRDTMILGESGIIAISPPWNRPMFEPSYRRLTWPNGAIATAYSAEEADRLRGPQHTGAWCDELAAWRNLDATWNMLQFGLRLGKAPRVLATTTPRPIKLLKELIARPDFVVTRGKTSDNAANLPASFLETIVGRYQGTRLGRQELDAEILEDVQGALWSRERIEELRVAVAPPLRRVVVAIDPAVSSGENSDETGIIVAGLGVDGQGYVLADGSGRYAPTEWASKAIALYHRHGGDRIIAEVNQGGALVEATLRVVDESIPYKAVHASRGKIIRAEPVSALYEQGRVHHVGAFPELEDQLCTFAPGSTHSPGRLDAMVYALTELCVGAGTTGIIDFYRDEVAKMNAMQEPRYGADSPDPSTLIRLRAPADFSGTMIAMSGRVVKIESDGTALLTPDDAKPLRAMGWTEIVKEDANVE